MVVHSFCRKYFHVYFKSNKNVSILNKQKRVRDNNRLFLSLEEKGSLPGVGMYIFKHTASKSRMSGCCIFNFSVNYGLSIVVNLVLKTELRK